MPKIWLKMKKSRDKPNSPQYCGYSKSGIRIPVPPLAPTTTTQYIFSLSNILKGLTLFAWTMNLTISPFQLHSSSTFLKPIYFRNQNFYNCYVGTYIFFNSTQVNLKLICIQKLGCLLFHFQNAKSIQKCQANVLIFLNKFVFDDF